MATQKPNKFNKQNLNEIYGKKQPRRAPQTSDSAPSSATRRSPAGGGMLVFTVPVKKESALHPFPFKTNLRKDQSQSIPETQSSKTETESLNQAPKPISETSKPLGDQTLSSSVSEPSADISLRPQGSHSQLSRKPINPPGNFSESKTSPAKNEETENNAFPANETVEPPKPLARPEPFRPPHMRADASSLPPPLPPPSLTASRRGTEGRNFRSNQRERGHQFSERYDSESIGSGDVGTHQSGRSNRDSSFAGSESYGYSRGSLERPSRNPSDVNFGDSDELKGSRERSRNRPGGTGRESRGRLGSCEEHFKDDKRYAIQNLRQHSYGETRQYSGGDLRNQHGGTHRASEPENVAYSGYGGRVPGSANNPSSFYRGSGSPARRNEHQYAGRLREMHISERGSGSNEIQRTDVDRRCPSSVDQRGVNRSDPIERESQFHGRWSYNSNLVEPKVATYRHQDQHLYERFTSASRLQSNDSSYNRGLANTKEPYNRFGSSRPVKEISRAEASARAEDMQFSRNKQQSSGKDQKASYVQGMKDEGQVHSRRGYNTGFFERYRSTPEDRASFSKPTGGYGRGPSQYSFASNPRSANYQSNRTVDQQTTSHGLGSASDSWRKDRLTQDTELHGHSTRGGTLPSDKFQGGEFT